MCGILAMFSTQERISSLSLKQGIEALKHRGPDEQSFWVSANKRVALGHTRLSIIDLIVAILTKCFSITLMLEVN